MSGDAHGETIGTTPPEGKLWPTYDFMPTYSQGGYASDHAMEPSDDGEWVRVEDAQAALALAQQERDNARQVMWTCGCGWINGVNLATCAMCTRVPDDNAVSYSADIENLRKSKQAAEQTHAARVAALNLLVTEWQNAAQTFPRHSTEWSILWGHAEKVRAALTRSKEPR